MDDNFSSRVKDVISYSKLLEMFWENHNPTTLNMQGVDKGTQYRSVIFFHNEEQSKTAEELKVQQQENWKDKIVTQIVPATTFYRAEEYHQDFYKKQAMRYEMYAKASGRKGYIEETWGND